MHRTAIVPLLIVGLVAVVGCRADTATFEEQPGTDLETPEALQNPPVDTAERTPAQGQPVPAAPTAGDTLGDTTVLDTTP